MKLCGLTLLLLAVTASMGQSPVPKGATTQPGEMDRADIERLVGNLGSRSRLVRESAEKRLVEIGLPAVRPLRAAAGSDDAEVRARASAVLLAIAQARKVCVKELGKVPQPFKDTRLYVSPDGEHYAYILQVGGKEILVFDGNRSPAWDSIQYVGPFSADGKHFPYQATESGNSFIIFAGEKKDPIPIIGTGRAVYSADCRRYAYFVKQDPEEWIVCDGKAQPRYKRVGQYTFSSDGKHFAYAARDANEAEFVILDGKALGPYEDVGSSIAFSPDSKRLAYTVRRLGKEMLICDGKQWHGYAKVFYPMFSPDSNSLACWARSADGKQCFVLRDGKQIAQMSGEPRLTFSPDGKVLACSTWNGSELYRLVEKAELLATGYDCASQPVFSPDGRHIACALGKDMRWWVCVDGNNLAGRYDPENVKHWDGPTGGGTSMSLNSPGFSADGRHVYWKGFRGPPGNLPPGNREHFIVCDGFEGPPHEDLWIPEDFRNHAKSLRYVVRDGENVRLMEFAWPEPMTWRDAVE